MKNPSSFNPFIQASPRPPPFFFRLSRRPTTILFMMSFFLPAAYDVPLTRLEPLIRAPFCSSLVFLSLCPSPAVSSVFFVRQNKFALRAGHLFALLATNLIFPCLFVGARCERTSPVFFLPEAFPPVIMPDHAYVSSEPSPLAWLEPQLRPTRFFRPLTIFFLCTLVALVSPPPASVFEALPSVFPPVCLEKHFSGSSEPLFPR